MMHVFDTCTSLIKCGKVYVGKTKRRLKNRMLEHFKNIRQRCPNHIVSRHYTDAVAMTMQG